MRRASGFEPTREFTRRRGFKFTRHADAMASREGRQATSLSSWGTGIKASVPNRIDGQRAAEINWTLTGGWMVNQEGYTGVKFDPRPRLIRNVEDALRGMK